MTDLDSFAAANLLEYKNKNLLRILAETAPGEGVYVKRGGRSLVSFASNDYLGLSANPKLKKAAIAAIKKYGTGAGASRYITGNHPLYDILEKKIAEYKGFPSAIAVGSGYLANIGAISALSGEGDLIIADKLAHASIIDGAKLSGAKILRFKHNDVESLERILKRNRAESKNCLVITETIFSMTGDKSPLKEIAKTAKKYDSWVLADAAHSLYEKKSYPEGNFLLMGTFSKALGSYGGYICGSKKAIDFLRNRMRSSIFTTALPPAVIASSIEALKIVNKEKKLAKKALENAVLFSKLMKLPVAQSAIVPFVVGDAKKSLEIAKKLERKGFLSVAVRPPTVPQNTSRLRFSFSALHSAKQIEQLVLALKNIKL